MKIQEATNIIVPSYPTPAPIVANGDDQETCASRAKAFAGQLREALHAEFAIIDLEQETVLPCNENVPECNWLGWIELARQVAQRGKPEFVADEDPLLVLAVPLPSPNQLSLVALGLFLARNLEESDDLTRACQSLGLDLQAAQAWVSQQTPQDASMLMRLSGLLCEKLSAEVRADDLEAEVEQVTGNLLYTYEEISLLHRLTQNLKLTSSDTRLGQLALEWMSDVVPALGLALKLKPERVQSDEPSVNHEVAHKSVVLTHGDCPIEASEFDAFVEYLGKNALQEPIVLNRNVTSNAAWKYSQINEVMSVPLAEGDNVFGWLLALNHRDGEEFGTIEASLLSSVGVILGIHRGNTELYHEQSEFLANVVRALTSAIDAKDPYTCGHSDRVARVSVRLAQELGCDAETLNTLYLSGLLHDVGKIGIDDNVLRKPGKLTDAEYEHIKMHPELGYKILKDLKQLDQVLPVVLHHHEAWNGKGYPHRLAGEEIPFLARICAVADSFDAMSSDRPYRKGMPYEKLEAILRHGAGEQWDADVVDAYFKARADIYEIADHDRDGLKLEVPQWS